MRRFESAAKTFAPFSLGLKIAVPVQMWDLTAAMFVL